MLKRAMTAVAGLYGAGLGVYYLLQRGNLPFGLRPEHGKPQLPYTGPYDPMGLSLNNAVENAFGLAFITVGLGLCYSAWRQREWTAPFATLLAVGGATFGMILIDSSSYFGLLDWGWKGSALFLVAALLGLTTLVIAALPISKKLSS